MPRRRHRNARREIQKFIPVRIFDTTPKPALHHQWIAPRIARRKIKLVFRNNFLRARSRQRPNKLRSEPRVRLRARNPNNLLCLCAHQISPFALQQIEGHALRRHERSAHLDEVERTYDTIALQK
jgi:hypothetical protein